MKTQQEATMLTKSDTSTLMETQSNALLPIEILADRANQVRSALSRCMQEGTDFGIIPFTGDKKTLLKPGGEKLAMLFQLSPSFDDEYKHNGEHLTIISKCTLVHRKTGEIWGNASAICSTMEKKYRYISVSTGQPVPKEYWKARETGSDYQLPEGTKAKKIDGQWMLTKKCENPDIADTYNTVIKIAQKRSFIAAVLFVTGGSGLFTQDLEDFEDNPPKPQPTQKHTIKPNYKPKPQPTQDNGNGSQIGEVIDLMAKLNKECEKKLISMEAIYFEQIDEYKRAINNKEFGVAKEIIFEIAKEEGVEL